MIGFVTRYLSLLQKLCIALLLAWCGLMLVMLWRSGVAETREAQAMGRRFVIHIENGRVEGGPVVAPAAEKTAKAEELVVPQSDASAYEEEEVVVVDIPAVQPSGTPIAAVKDDMLEKVAGVTLPRISEAGVKPWYYYVTPYRRQNESPVVAIIITGLGQNKKANEIALAMDNRIGLSFSPYARALGSWTTASRLTGHEMYVDLPLQTANYPSDDPGPFGILGVRNNNDNLKNLYWAMSRFQGYVGMVAPIGEVVTNKADAFKPLADEMVKRGLLLVLGRDTAVDDKGPVGASKVPAISADVWIDEELTEMSIQARLGTLEQVAQRNGYAIGIAQGYPLSLTQIKHWQESLAERGLILAPVSFVAKLKNN